MPSKVAERMVVAVSVSESPDSAQLGLGNVHLQEAVGEIAMHLLAHGACLAYGGDLRKQGFAELLFELLDRYWRRADGSRVRVTNYLAWPVHMGMNADSLADVSSDIHEHARLALLGQDGRRVTIKERQKMPACEPDKQAWSAGLTAMRRTMLRETDARIVLGGRVEGYMGRMPGIAEEALLSLESGQPLFLVGGFGGCAMDVAESLGILKTQEGCRKSWSCRSMLERYGPNDLHNGLSPDENRVLASSPHIGRAIILILRGIYRLQRLNKSVVKAG